MDLQWNDYHDREPLKVQRAQLHLFDLWCTGRITPRVACTFAFDDIPAALDVVANAGTRARW
jgi:NADPH:quinone reductase-like Zn-dependent oxidoreductase